MKSKNTVKSINSNFMNKEQQALANMQAIQSAKRYSLEYVGNLLKVGKLENVNNVESLIEEAKKIERYIWSDVEDGRPKHIVTP